MEKLAIQDCEGQYTKVINRRVREFFWHKSAISLYIDIKSDLRRFLSSSDSSYNKSDDLAISFITDLSFFI